MLLGYNFPLLLLISLCECVAGHRLKQTDVRSIVDASLLSLLGEPKTWSEEQPFARRGPESLSVTVSAFNFRLVST